VTIKRTTF